jgi:hypothetical protein
MASSSTRAGVVGGAAVGAAGDVVAVLVAVAATGEMVIAGGAVGVVGMTDARGWSGCREGGKVECGKWGGWVCRCSRCSTGDLFFWANALSQRPDAAAPRWGRLPCI